MSVSPALMPAVVAPTIRKVVTPENKRRRAELERNFDKVMRLRAAQRDSKGLIKDADLYRKYDDRADHVLWLIRKGMAEGRWDS